MLQAGQLVLGLDTEFPPIGFIDETGEIVGFDIDVAREVCSRLGVTLVPKGIDWDHKEEGEVDAILVDSVAAFYSVFSSDQLYYILPESLGQEEYAIGAHWHHERYDGSGYPDGLAGTAISEEARIIAVADAYDAMTSRRSYRDVLSQETVRREIEAGKGTQFDPAFADFMLQMIDEDRDYRLRGQ